MVELLWVQFWSSKLQNEIVLSTTKAECLALSMSMHELLPMHMLMHNITKAGLVHLQLDDNASYTITNSLEQSKVFEDNASCIIFATTDQYHPHTKHIGIK